MECSLQWGCANRVVNYSILYSALSCIKLLWLNLFLYSLFCFIDLCLLVHFYIWRTYPPSVLFSPWQFPDFFFWHIFLKFVFNWSLIALQCCSFPLYNSMNQLYVYVYPVLLSFPPTWHLYFLKFALELFKICFSIIFPC